MLGSSRSHCPLCVVFLGKTCIPMCSSLLLLLLLLSFCSSASCACRSWAAHDNPCARAWVAPRLVLVLVAAMHPVRVIVASVHMHSVDHLPTR